MFKKLRNKIIIITMTVTTAVLILAGGSIMFFVSSTRPEPKPFPTPFNAPDFKAPSSSFNGFSDQEVREYIKTDRKEGNNRLLSTLLSVGVSIEIIVFIVTYYLSKKIVEPVKDSYEKQKLFIANASHELKTPLAVIQANMEAIEVKKDSEKWKDNIENEITHANKLVLNLLQLAKFDSDSDIKKETEEVDLEATLKERIEIFKPRFSGKITMKKIGKIKKAQLPKQDVLQALDILLDNATKYGKKKISVVVEDGKISVINDGTTVKKEDLKKIFDRFYQTDKTSEGSGLGLAIVSAVCKQNGWNIYCESDDKTTKFVLSFV